MKSDKIACVDTQILYWALVKKSPPNDPLASDRAVNLFRWMDDQDYKLIVPTLVVGEILVAVPQERHGEVLAQFEENWVIADYDLRAAAEFAKLRQKHLSETANRELRKLMNGIPKRVIVADMLILAVAIANKADCLVTDDIDLSRLAKDNIAVLSSNDVPFQPTFLP